MVAAAACVSCSPQRPLRPALALLALPVLLLPLQPRPRCLGVGAVGAGRPSLRLLLLRGAAPPQQHPQQRQANLIISPGRVAAATQALWRCTHTSAAKLTAVVGHRRRGSRLPLLFPSPCRVLFLTTRVSDPKGATTRTTTTALAVRRQP